MALILTEAVKNGSVAWKWTGAVNTDCRANTFTTVVKKGHDGPHITED